MGVTPPPPPWEIALCVSNLFLTASARMLCIFLERHSKWLKVTLYTNNLTMKNQHAGLLSRAGGQGFSPATVNVASGYSHRKIEEK